MLRFRLKRNAVCCITAVSMLPVCCYADLKYEQVTEIKDGIMESLGKLAGMFGAKGLERTTTSTYLKGDRLRTDQLEGEALVSSQIIQLDREQVLSLDHKKKTYTVMTFAEMKAQMEKALASMKSAPQNQNPKPDPQKPDVKVEPKIIVKDTGETRLINGFNTRRVLLTVEIEGEDQKTKDKGAMGADTELWLTKDIAGFDEQNKFYMKYAQKMASPELIKNMGMSPAMRQDPRMAESMQAMQQKAKSLEGVAILTVMSFNLSGTPSAETQAQASSQPRQSSSAERPPDSVGDAIGKALGGFGGFGRKKKKEEPAPPAQTSQPSSATSDGKVSATLMTSTTEMKSFSTAALDAALFDAPAGYQLNQK